MAIKSCAKVKAIDSLFPSFQAALSPSSCAGATSPSLLIRQMPASRIHGNPMNSMKHSTTTAYKADDLSSSIATYNIRERLPVTHTKPQVQLGQRPAVYGAPSSQPHQFHPVLSYDAIRLPANHGGTLNSMDSSSQVVPAVTGRNLPTAADAVSSMDPRPLPASCANAFPAHPSQFSSSPLSLPTKISELKSVPTGAIDARTAANSRLVPPAFDSTTPSERTLIILDYDDTLLPTNWVAVQHRIGLNDPVPLIIQNHLEELSNLAIKTIDLCRKTGKLIVVTNASIEWVARSGEKFIPAVWRHLRACGIEIVSARDRWQSTGMAQRHWKLKIFQETIQSSFEKQPNSGSDCCIISIGDGEGEREACLEMWRQSGISEWMFKSLKLLAQPTCNQLISEHLLIQQAFPDILKVSQSLDMAIVDYKQSPTRVPSDKNNSAQGGNAMLQEAKADCSGQVSPDSLTKGQYQVDGDRRMVGRVTDVQREVGTDAFVDAISEKLKNGSIL